MEMSIVLEKEHEFNQLDICTWTMKIVGLIFRSSCKCTSQT
jgi:hypothetical protein